MHLVYFRVATNGRDEKDTEFHQCTAFGKTEELIGEYLTTGRPVYLDGRLQTRAYDDPDGVRRWATTMSSTACRCSTTAGLTGSS
jgi:single-strand DNA-binding protein